MHPGRVLYICTYAAAEFDFTGWEEVEIDDSVTNNSSTTVYTVMVPLGTTHFSNDTPSGHTTAIVNGSEKAAAYGLYIFDNPFWKETDHRYCNIFSARFHD